MFLWLLDHDRKLDERRPGWPTVQGRVLSSGASRTGYDSDTEMTVRVAFEYKLKNRTYSEEQSWRIEPSSGRDSFRENIRHRYRHGTVVPIHYNPSNHSDSVVNPRGRYLDTWQSHVGRLAAFPAIIGSIILLFIIFGGFVWLIQTLNGRLLWKADGGKSTGAESADVP